MPLAHRKNGGSEGLFDAGIEPHQIFLKRRARHHQAAAGRSGVLKIGQNLKFDWQIFAQRGITIAPYDDTLLMSYVVDAGRSDHGLSPLARRYFDHTVIDYNEVTKAGKTKVTVRLRRDQQSRRIRSRRCRRHLACCGTSWRPPCRRAV